MVIVPKNTLHFPAADFLRNLILEYSNKETIVVLDGKHVGNIDITMAKVHHKINVCHKMYF